MCARSLNKWCLRLDICMCAGGYFVDVFNVCVVRGVGAVCCYGVFVGWVWWGGVGVRACVSVLYFCCCFCSSVYLSVDA